MIGYMYNIKTKMNERDEFHLSQNEIYSNTLDCNVYIEIEDYEEYLGRKLDEKISFSLSEFMNTTDINRIYKKNVSLIDLLYTINITMLFNNIMANDFMHSRSLNTSSVSFELKEDNVNIFNSIILKLNSSSISGIKKVFFNNMYMEYDKKNIDDIIELFENSTDEYMYIQLYGRMYIRVHRDDLLDTKCFYSIINVYLPDEEIIPEDTYRSYMEEFLCYSDSGRISNPIDAHKYFRINNIYPYVSIIQDIWKHIVNNYELKSVNFEPLIIENNSHIRMKSNPLIRYYPSTYTGMYNMMETITIDL